MLVTSKDEWKKPLKLSVKEQTLSATAFSKSNMQKKFRFPLSFLITQTLWYHFTGKYFCKETKISNSYEQLTISSVALVIKNKILPEVETLKFKQENELNFSYEIIYNALGKSNGMFAISVKILNRAKLL